MKKIDILICVVIVSAMRGIAGAESFEQQALRISQQTKNAALSIKEKAVAAQFQQGTGLAASVHFEGEMGIYGDTRSALLEEYALGSAESEARGKCHAAGHTYCKTINEKVTWVHNGIQTLVIVEPVQIPSKAEKIHAEVEVNGGDLYHAGVLRMAEKSAVATCQNVRYKNCLPIASSMIGCRQGGNPGQLCRAKATALGWND